MKIHLKSVHEKKKPLKCSICNTSFSSKQNLKKHISEKHEGKKEYYECNICLKTYGERFRLKEHVLKIHEGKKLFNCQDCNTSFKTKYCLNTHIEIDH